jgi:hypothetical protein
MALVHAPAIDCKNANNVGQPDYRIETRKATGPEILAIVLSNMEPPGQSCLVCRSWAAFDQLAQIAYQSLEPERDVAQQVIIFAD